MGEQPGLSEDDNIMKSAYNYRSNQNILHYDLKSHLRVLEHVRKDRIMGPSSKYIRSLSPKHRVIEPITPVCSFDSFHSKRSGEYYRFSIDRPRSIKVNRLGSSSSTLDNHLQHFNHGLSHADDHDVDRDVDADIKNYKGITTEKDLKELHQQYYKFINHRDHKKMKQSNVNSHLFKKKWTKPEIAELDYKPYHKCKTKAEDHPELVVKDSSTITAIGSTILALEGTSNSINLIMDRSSWPNSELSRHNTSSDIHHHPPSLRRNSEAQYRSPMWSSSSSSSHPATSHIPQSHSLTHTPSSSSAEPQSKHYISPIKPEISHSSSSDICTTTSTSSRPRSAVPQSSTIISTSKPVITHHKLRPRSAVTFTTSSPIPESPGSHSSSQLIHPSSSSSPRPHSASPSSTSPTADVHKSIIIRRPHSALPQSSSSVSLTSQQILKEHHIPSNRDSYNALYSHPTSLTITAPHHSSISTRPNSAAVPQTSALSPYLIIPPRPQSAAPNMMEISRTQSRPSSTRRRKPKLNNFHTRY